MRRRRTIYDASWHQEHDRLMHATRSQQCRGSFLEAGQGGCFGLRPRPSCSPKKLVDALTRRAQPTQNQRLTVATVSQNCHTRGTCGAHLCGGPVAELRERPKKILLQTQRNCGRLDLWRTCRSKP
jgi:hypothetical protein